MATKDTTEKLRIKLTIARDESPDLHRVLNGIQDRLQRTRRLKDLASKGLFAERVAGGILVGLAPAAIGQPAKAPVAPLGGESVASMLDWAGGGGNPV